MSGEQRKQTQTPIALLCPFVPLVLGACLLGPSEVERERVVHDDMVHPISQMETSRKRERKGRPFFSLFCSVFFFSLDHESRACVCARKLPCLEQKGDEDEGGCNRMAQG